MSEVRPSLRLFPHNKFNPNAYTIDYSVNFNNQSVLSIYTQFFEGKWGYIIVTIIVAVLISIALNRSLDKYLPIQKNTETVNTPKFISALLGSCRTNPGGWAPTGINEYVVRLYTDTRSKRG